MTPKLTLFYSPGACSLVAHTALIMSGLPAERSCVRIGDGENRRERFLAMSPQGRVPVLRVDEAIITESLAILTYLDAAAPRAGILPIASPTTKARAMQRLSYFVSTVHIGFAQLWRPERFSDESTASDLIRQGGRHALRACFKEIDAMTSHGWLAGNTFTVTDVYPVVFWRWAHRAGFDLAHYDAWRAFVAVALRQPALELARLEEGLELAEFPDHADVERHEEVAGRTHDRVPRASR